MAVEGELQSMFLSDIDIQQLTGWDVVMVEEYSNIIRNTKLVAQSADKSETGVAEAKESIALTDANLLSTNSTVAAISVSVNANTLGLSAHLSATSAHGATGDLVGAGDYCTTIVGGVVLLSELVSDASNSSAQVVLADIAAAPAAYDQAYAQSMADMSNDIKSKHNDLMLDLNNAIAQLNDILSKAKTANQMST